MREDEAKKMMCCGPPSINHGGDHRCFGSECMAWRYIAVGRAHRVVGVTYGYCGLAAPETFHWKPEDG